MPDETPTDDARLYVPQSQDWRVRIKTGSERAYCYAKRHDEDHFHLILGGEIFLEGGHEKYCLTCALNLGLVTRNRLFWQRVAEE